MLVTTKLLSVFVLVVFLGTMFFTLFHMSMGMDMSEGMAGCPFMSHEQVICPMNLADHIGAWESAFVAIVPTLILLIAILGSVAFIISIAPNLIRKIRYLSLPLNRCFHKRTYAFSYRPLQELFSSGILHPKLF